MRRCPGRECGFAVSEHDSFCGWCSLELQQLAVTGCDPGAEGVARIYVTPDGSCASQLGLVAIGAFPIEIVRVRWMGDHGALPICLLADRVPLTPDKTTPVPLGFVKLSSGLGRLQSGRLVFESSTGASWTLNASVAAAPEFAVDVEHGGEVSEDTLILRDHDPDLGLSLAVTCAASSARVTRVRAALDGAPIPTVDGGSAAATPNTPYVAVRSRLPHVIQGASGLGLVVHLDTTAWKDGHNTALRITIQVPPFTKDFSVETKLVYERPALVEFDCDSRVIFPSVVRGTTPKSRVLRLVNRGSRTARIGDGYALGLPPWAALEVPPQSRELPPPEEGVPAPRDVHLVVDPRHPDLPAHGEDADIGFEIDVDSGPRPKGALFVMDFVEPEPFPMEVTVDFGTSGICCAVREGGAPEPTLLEFDGVRQGVTTTRLPSVIFFSSLADEGGPTYEIGHRARPYITASGANPWCYVRSVKRLLGGGPIRILGAKDEGARMARFEPAQIVELILRRLFEMISERYVRRVQAVNITFPAVFMPHQLRELKRGFELAGVPTKRIRCRVDEPTAGALWYIRRQIAAQQAAGRLDGGPSEYSLATFDVGAGTTDVTLLRVRVTQKRLEDSPRLRSEIQIEVLRSTGDGAYGGDDMTEAFLDLFVEGFATQLNKKKALPKKARVTPHARIVADPSLLFYEEKGETDGRWQGIAKQNHATYWWAFEDAKIAACDHVRSLMDQEGLAVRLPRSLKRDQDAMRFGEKAPAGLRLRLADVHGLSQEMGPWKLDRPEVAGLDVRVTFGDLLERWRRRLDLIAERLDVISDEALGHPPDAILVSGLASRNPVVGAVLAEKFGEQRVQFPPADSNADDASGTSHAEKAMVALGACEVIVMLRDWGGSGIRFTGRDGAGVDGILRSLPAPIVIAGAVEASGVTFRTVFPSGQSLPGVSPTVLRLYLEPEPGADTVVGVAAEELLVDLRGGTLGDGHESMGVLRARIDGVTGPTPFVFEIREDLSVAAHALDAGRLADRGLHVNGRGQLTDANGDLTLLTPGNVCEEVPVLATYEVQTNRTGDRA